MPSRLREIVAGEHVDPLLAVPLTDEELFPPLALSPILRPHHYLNATIDLIPGAMLGFFGALGMGEYWYSMLDPFSSAISALMIFVLIFGLVIALAILASASSLYYQLMQIYFAGMLAAIHTVAGTALCFILAMLIAGGAGMGAHNVIVFYVIASVVTPAALFILLRILYWETLRGALLLFSENRRTDPSMREAGIPEAVPSMYGYDAIERRDKDGR